MGRNSGWVEIVAVKKSVWLAAGPMVNPRLVKTKEVPNCNGGSAQRWASFDSALNVVVALELDAARSNDGFRVANGGGAEVKC